MDFFKLNEIFGMNLPDVKNGRVGPLFPEEFYRRGFMQHLPGPEPGIRYELLTGRKKILQIFPVSGHTTIAAMREKNLTKPPIT